MYTEEQIKKDREFVATVMTDLCNRAKDMWVVCCIWESPITHMLEHREGFFLDYMEAEIFHDMLEDTYETKYHLRHEVYISRTIS